MPTVPTDIPTVDLQPRSPVAFQAGDVKPVENFGAKQMTEFGNTLTKVAVDMMAEANESRVSEALNTFNTKRLVHQTEAFKLRGKNALAGIDGQSLPDAFVGNLSKDAEEIAKGLGNDTQRKRFAERAAPSLLQFRGVLNTHMLEQQKAYDDETDKSALITAVREAAVAQSSVDLKNTATSIAAGQAMVNSTSTIKGVIDRMAKRNGWDDVTKEEKMVEAMSSMHSGVIRSMIETNRPTEAEAWYTTNKAMMTERDRTAISGMIKTGLEIKTAEDTAGTIWSELGPKGVNDPVRIFDMEERMRKELKDNPGALKNGIAALRERAAAFNAQQSEVNAGNVNRVFGLIDSGTSMTQVQRSAAWLALPEAKRHEIKKSMEQGDNLLQANAAEYLTITDPNVLAKMTRAQVEETRTKFGMSATKHLLDKWDSLQKPGKMEEARIDKQDFDHIADQLGLRPYDPKKSEAERRGLGTLQYRVEQVIAIEQRSRGRALTREEKMGIMRREMATTVSVDGWFSNSTVPVINLTPEQATKVIVPPADRVKIADKMAKRFRETGDARFAPTEANLKFWYLVGKSPSAALIEQK